jgi:hypothetical protein
MRDHVTLMGSEEVANAGHAMQSAASDFSRIPPTGSTNPLNVISPVMAIS